MKVPVSWLADFVDMQTTDPEELEEILGTLGHEVEGWEIVEPTFEGVVIAEVVSVEPHPNADKVRFCRVDTGSETLDVVCGAWNFEAGAVVAYATVGARLGIDQEEPFEISQRKIRGVVSNGMICSARELGLGEDHEGIMVLDALGVADPSDVGRDAAEVLPIRDVVLDISITPNRGDCMSILGMARELAAYWNVGVRAPDPVLADDGPQISTTITIEDAEACPRFAARQIEGVEIKASPLWMQLRLLAVGQRPISNVVDVSNYVMFELGHPIHTFDADTLTDNTLVIRRAQPGERLRTLDGVDRPLLADDIVVTDPSGPVALAGVMGGESTEVTDATRSILIEAANWHPPSIMHTSRRLGLRSEASSRFERGVDPNLSELATRRTAELIQATGGGQIHAGVVDTYPTVLQPWTVEVSARELARLLGPTPDLEASSRLLERLGFGVSIDGSTAAVEVPTRRADVTRPADVVEEVARLYGYDEFEDKVRRGFSGHLTPGQEMERKVRHTMVGAGYYEAQTLSFIGQADLDKLRIPASDPRSRGIVVLNPLRDEEGTMRTTLLPGLLKAAAYNVGHGTDDVSLFETGRVFIPEADPVDYRIPRQPEHLGWMALGSTGGAGFNGAQRPVDFFTASGVVELLEGLTGLDISLRAEALPSLHPGRSAQVVVDGESIGFVGELHPAVARDFGLKGRVAVGELELGVLTAELEMWSFRSVSSFPPVRFDLAFEVAEDVPAARIAAELVLAGGEELESVELFDEFRGGPLGAGRKSLAYRLVLRAADRTFTDEEAAPVRQRMIDHVASTLGASLRGS
jgi:phenylalanyl-tRNA synthetase beta chain